MSGRQDLDAAPSKLHHVWYRHQPPHLPLNLVQLSKLRRLPQQEIWVGPVWLDYIWMQCHRFLFSLRDIYEHRCVWLPQRFYEPFLYTFATQGDQTLRDAYLLRLMCQAPAAFLLSALSLHRRYRISRVHLRHSVVHTDSCTCTHKFLLERADLKRYCFKQTKYFLCNLSCDSKHLPSGGLDSICHPVSHDIGPLYVLDQTFKLACGATKTNFAPVKQSGLHSKP